MISSSPLIEIFRKYYEPLVLLSFAVVIFVFAHSALEGWWRFDDPMHLKNAFELSPWEYFFVPEVWRQEVSAANLTPWMTASYDLDLTLFGLNPKGFYAHHLIVIWLAACSTYFLLKLWVKPFFAMLGGILLIIGVPLTLTAQQLMTRHYLEGLVFTNLALFFYVSSLRRGKLYLGWIGGIFYLLATTAKEVYVPLAILLLFIPEKSFKQRIFASSPYFLMTLCYFFWRWFMLGTPIGGYGNPLDFNAILNLPVRIGDYLFGTNTLGKIAQLLTLAILGFAILRTPRSLPLLSISLVLILGPLLTISAIVGDRHLVAAWWALSCALMLALHQFRKPSRKVYISVLFCYVVIFFAASSQALQKQPSILAAARHFEVEGKFAFNGKSDEIMLVSPGLSRSFWFLYGLLSIRELEGESGRGPRMVVDEIQLEQIYTAPLAVWQFSEKCQCMQDITKDVPEILGKWNRKRIDKPLSLIMRYSDNVISWDFGPYKQGNYFLVDDARLGKVPMLTSDRRRVILPTFSFYLRYDSPEGWITYSPMLKFAPSEGILKWRR